MKERPHQCKDALFFGESSKEKEIRFDRIELVRVDNLAGHIRLAIGQEVLHCNSTAGITTSIEFALHEFARRNDFVDFVVRMMIFQEFRFQERQTALSFRSFNTSLLYRVEEPTVKAVITDFAVTIHHRVCRAQQDVIVRSINHWHMVIF